MSEETWRTARLIPTSGIAGSEEQERRATSALLAVLSSVREFGRAITRPLGAPAGKIETFIEVPFKLRGRQLFPDGLIRVTRGKQQWTGLVEVKTGNNCLRTEQIEAYLEIAREQRFDALLTVSNEIAPLPGQHPTPVNGHKLRSVGLYHLPWTEILTHAVVQKEHRGVADPDQAWILGELIRYLEHPRSGALEFSDMGPAWVSVREGALAGTLRAADAGVADVAGRFDALIRYACLALGRRLGVDVTPDLTSRELTDPGARIAFLADQIAFHGRIAGGIRIPGAIGPLQVTADLKSARITCHVDISAPNAGRSTTRVNWLVRQLREAPPGLRLEAYAAYSRGDCAAGTLREVQADPAVLVGESGKELRRFRVAQSKPAGTKRSTGRGSFIDSVLKSIDDFYEGVVQNLKPWLPAAPRLRSPEDARPVEPVGPSLSSSGFSSQDGADQQRSRFGPA